MRIKTEVRKQLIRNLNSIDSKLRFKQTSWNDAVKATFNKTGSYCFENLVYKNFDEAESLYKRFKG